MSQNDRQPGPDLVQSSAELLLEINSGDADRALRDAERLERHSGQYPDGTGFATGHWWMVQLRIRNIEKSRTQQG